MSLFRIIYLFYLFVLTKNLCNKSISTYGISLKKMLSKIPNYYRKIWCVFLDHKVQR